MNSTFCHTTHFLPLRQNNSFLLACLYVLEVLNRFHWQLFNQSLCKVSCMVLNPFFLLWQKKYVAKYQLHIGYNNIFTIWTLSTNVHLKALTKLRRNFFCPIHFWQSRKIGFWNFAAQNQIKNYSLKTIDHLSIYHKKYWLIYLKEFSRNISAWYVHITFLHFI